MTRAIFFYSKPPFILSHWGTWLSDGWYLIFTAVIDIFIKFSMKILRHFFSHFFNNIIFSFIWFFCSNYIFFSLFFARLWVCACFLFVGLSFPVQIERDTHIEVQSLTGNNETVPSSKMVKTFQAYLPPSNRTYSCVHCRAHLASHDELISKVKKFNARNASAVICCYFVFWLLLLLL